MAKVFRLQSEGDNTIEHWGNTTSYGRQSIDKIVDGNGDSVSKEITSIPSPFARIDLLKVAFQHVNNSNNVDGNTIYHKMVSDCLDIGEILFNIDKFENEIEIITWDPRQELNQLLNSYNEKHKQLGRTIELFLKQDADANNFDKLDRLYLLNYLKGTKTLNIIGSTSPVTLFATTANKLENAVDITFGSHKVFTGIQPLYKRDFEYQKYLYCLLKSYNTATSDFKAVFEYLFTFNYAKLNSEQRSIINTINQNTLVSEYSKISVSSNSYLEVLSHPLYKQVINNASISEKSGFIIAAQFETDEDMPMVLPVDIYSENTTYTSALWNRQNVAPFFDDKLLSERVLPFDGTKYPYLTISDFLEDYIVSLPYPVNDARFFDGNLKRNNTSSHYGYLLPIKETFFNYFSSEFLQGKVQGRNILEIEETFKEGIHYVDVTLRIPIKNDKFITYQRTYYSGDYNTKRADISKNKGAILTHTFSMAVSPFYKIDGLKNQHYRVGLFDKDMLDTIDNNPFMLNFFEKGAVSVVPKAIKQRRKDKQRDSIATNYYVLENSFDFIQLKTKQTNGIILPKFDKRPMGTNNFEFAVDFGTTNTHIEYKSDLNPTPQPLEFDSKEGQIVPLHDITNEKTALSFRKIMLGYVLHEIIDLEMFPIYIGKNNMYSFPQRTAISTNVNTNLTTTLYSNADTNIPFYYERKMVPRGIDTVKTNLKWTAFNNDLQSKSLVENYLETLAILMRNKVISNGGNLETVKMKWLYPSSMDRFRLNQLETTWEEIYKKYFSNNLNNIERISESVAPFYYYNTQGVNAMNNSVVSIDIGGGTTDVMVFTNNKPNLLTSFRFAANALFGDSIGANSDYNGWVLKYKKEFERLLDNNELGSIKDILGEISKNKSSEDIITLLFSLENNKDVIEKNSNISLSKFLQEDVDLKVAPLLFFNAIIYHIAHLMKNKGVVAPKYITFSGTGSKILNILDPNFKKQNLSGLVTEIFKDIYKDDAISISIKIDELVKEITCKGVLVAKDEVSNIDINKLKVVYLGENLNKDLIYEDLENKSIIDDVFIEYENYIRWFFDFNKKFSYKDNFGINSSGFGLYKGELKEHSKDTLMLYVNDMLNMYKGEEKNDLNETLFFYPLIGGINNLVYKLVEKDIE